MSRYDRKDPGTDPEYCNGLSPDPDVLCSCPWCNQTFEDTSPANDHYPYCSEWCGLMADIDNALERNDR